MVKATSESQAATWARRTAPEPEQVREGIWAVAIPAEKSPIAYTIDYVFETESGLAIVDTGWGEQSSADALARALESIGHDESEIQTILVTHMHPDHFGLVPSLLAGMPHRRLLMHEADLRLVDTRSDAVREATMPQWREIMLSTGAPAAIEITRRFPIHHRLDKSMDGQVRAVEDAEVITLGPWRLRAIWTPGHTPGHLCFLVEDHDLLISGDHILPTITPQVTQLSDPSQDILGTYLASLRALRTLEVAEVLPAHQYRFTGLAERIDELLAHHDRRLGMLVDALEEHPGQTCAALADALDWRHPLSAMPIDQARMAIKETLAHLLHLRRTERAHAVEGPPSTWWPTADSNSRMEVA